jgi:hypothetical protein
MDAAADMLVVTVVAVMVLYLAIVAALRWTGRSCNADPMQREAEERAEALLRDVLTDAEYAQLGECGYLEIRSPSQPMRTYRVPQRPGRVAVHEFGVEVESLCVAPVEWLPSGDVVLAHKLMIEGNEQEYLRRANHIRLRARTRVASVGR